MNAVINLATVVLIGRFSVDFFLPSRLLQTNILGAADVEGATFQMYIPQQNLQVSYGWGSLIVTPTRLQVQVTDAPFVRAADIVLSSLNHNSDRIIALGINYAVHVRMEHAYQRDRLGMRLMPAAAWGSWGAKVESQVRDSAIPNTHGGMITGTLRLQRAKSDETLYSHTDVTVEASNPFPDTGVYIAVNDNYQSERVIDYQKPPDSYSDARDVLLRRLEVDFDTAIIRAKEIINSIFEDQK